MFFRQLSAIPFSGGGFSDAAITEGLAEALMMFSSSNGSESHKKGDWTRHCVLIAASNPYPLPTAVYYPVTQNLEQNEDNKMRTNHQLSDAETVARAFPQCSVSLSVICPRQRPKLKAIYNAGKRDPQTADPTIDPSKNPNKFLLLISEDFITACAASRRTAPASSAPDRSQVGMDTTSVPSVSGPPATSNQAVSAMSPQAGNIPASIISTESTTVTSITGPALPHILTAQLVASLQSASPISVSQEMVPDSENVKETKHIVSGTSESLLRPFSGAAAPKVRILNDVAQACQVLTGGTSIGVQSTGGTPNLPNMISGGMTGSLPSAEIGQTLNQNSVPASFALMAPYTCGNSNLMSQMIPTPGMTQHVQLGLQPQRNSRTEEAGMPRSQQKTSATLPSARPNFTEFWEGDLYGQKQGEPVLMTRIKAYRIGSASRTFAENWPPGIRIVGLLELDYMNNPNVRRNSAVVILRTLTDLHFFTQLLEKKLCAVAELPSKKLLLAGSDKACRIIGLVVPRDTVLEAKPAVACTTSTATSRARISTATSRAPTSGKTPTVEPTN